MVSSYKSYGNLIRNASIFGLSDAIAASKYPMSTDTDKCSTELTDTAISLAQSAMGTGHDNWLSGVVVQFDLTCTVKMWTEFERYHFAQIVSSQSTMHKIEKFNLSEQCSPYVSKRILDVMSELKNDYLNDPTPENRLRLLYSCPVGIRLTACITTNYRQLKTMYAQRKNHRLPEWRDFCKWIETLPYSELITGGNANES